MNRKKPTGEEYEKFREQWWAGNHQEKVSLASQWGVGYDTARHWVSDGPPTTEKNGFQKIAEQMVITLGGRPKTLEDQIADLFEYPNEATPLQTTKDMSVAVVLGDTHYPYVDAALLDPIAEFLQDIKPDYTIYNGDMTDFYQVSNFSKDPGRLDELQNDIDMTTELFRCHRSLLPNTQMYFIEGTHEYRWIKYLQDKAPAVSKLRGATIPALYRLQDYTITYVPYERGLLINDTFIILHGDIASKHSSFTAKAQFDKHGGSGLCNHTHRLGSYFKRDRTGTYGWWENGCLCSLHPDWIQNPNWQQGFSVMHIADNGRFFVEQIPIVDHKFIYGGTLYK